MYGSYKVFGFKPNTSQCLLFYDDRWSSLITNDLTITIAIQLTASVGIIVIMICSVDQKCSKRPVYKTLGVVIQCIILHMYLNYPKIHRLDSPKSNLFPFKKHCSELIDLAIQRVSRYPPLLSFRLNILWFHVLSQSTLLFRLIWHSLWLVSHRDNSKLCD